MTPDELEHLVSEAASGSPTEPRLADRITSIEVIHHE